jgi:hypothetical protein
MTSLRFSSPPLMGREISARGISSFIQLAESHTFVDKTYAIIEFLQFGVQPAHLILRGRHSGKTTLLRSFQ